MMEPSDVKFQCQTLAVNQNEQIDGVSSEVSLLELHRSPLQSFAVSLCTSASPPLTQVPPEKIKKLTAREKAARGVRACEDARTHTLLVLLVVSCGWRGCEICFRYFNS